MQEIKSVKRNLKRKQIVQIKCENIKSVKKNRNLSENAQKNEKKKSFF